MSGFAERVARGAPASRPRAAWALPIIFTVALMPLAPAASAGPANPSAVRIETSQQLFATLCALHAAGFSAAADSEQFSPFPSGLRDKLLAMNGPAVDDLRAFYRDHALGSPSETLSRYISLSLVVGPPPQFEFQFSREDLPSDVLAIEGFRDLLVSFYHEQHLEELWAQVQPLYEKESARLRAPVAQVVEVAAGYLREVVPTAGRRTFTVYVEPLVGRTTNFRLYRDEYAIVVNPGPRISLDPIRHAFLHFLLDPLPLRYRAVVQSKAALLDDAARAPRLPHFYQEDFTALFTECMVRAVELRLRRLPPTGLDAAVDQADLDGYVLVRPILHQLERFDQSQPSMSRMFPELIKGIEVEQEARRLQRVQFAELSAAEDTSGVPAGETPAASELDRWLEQGDRQIASADAAGAATTFERVLEKYPGTPRATYGLAVASVLSGKAERARDLFQKLVMPDPRGDLATKDPVILAWSHVYLGRMRDVGGDRELALAEYRAALSVEGAPESARLAAQRGIEQGYKLPAKAREASQPKP